MIYTVIILINYCVPVLFKKKKRVTEMETTLGHLIHVNGEGRERVTAGQMTSSVPSQATLSFPFLLDKLSCQLTDPNSQHVECSITSTQPGMATVSYTPTLRGAHQLKITVGDVDTDIPGSPFTVHVLPSLEMRGMPIHAITGVHSPWGVAVSESGEVVVSEYEGHCISVFDREGKKIRTFGSYGSNKGQFKYPRGVSITSDNHILVVDSCNHRIQMFTMEGEFEKSVGELGNETLKFRYPVGIAVHPSGLVFVVDEFNYRIQVLSPDLHFINKLPFGSEGSGPGQFNHPSDVAYDNSGKVYVTDCFTHRVQSITAGGQFISSFGSKGSQPGQLYHPSGICIDSTDTVYVTDENHRVSAFRNGKFLKCFGKRGTGVGELKHPNGIAVDNTTGNLYVCDDFNHRVVVY